MRFWDDCDSLRGSIRFLKWSKLLDRMVLVRRPSYQPLELNNLLAALESESCLLSFEGFSSSPAKKRGGDNWLTFPLAFPLDYRLKESHEHTFITAVAFPSCTAPLDPSQDCFSYLTNRRLKYDSVLRQRHMKSSSVSLQMKGPWKPVWYQVRQVTYDRTEKKKLVAQHKDSFSTVLNPLQTP